LLPLIVSLVGLLLIVMIGYNMIQQYKQKTEINKRISLAKQSAIISEVDELLMQATKIPFSKSLLLILQNRTRNALLTKINMSPNSPAIREHFADTEAQIKQINDSYTSPDLNNFKLPNDPKEAVALVQVAKKLRAVLRSEHTKGKISTNIFVAENRSLELLQLKINLENNIKRVEQARSLDQYGTAKQMLDKIINVLESLPDRDKHLEERLKLLLQYRVEVNELHEEKVVTPPLKQTNLEAARLAKEKERDQLFAEKKKW